MTKVEKIEIRIGNKTLSLTPEELRELRDVLDMTFPKTTTVAVYPPVVYPTPWKWRHWEPYWCNQSGTLSLTATSYKT